MRSQSSSDGSADVTNEGTTWRREVVSFSISTAGHEVLDYALVYYEFSVRGGGAPSSSRQVGGICVDQGGRIQSIVLIEMRIN